METVVNVILLMVFVNVGIGLFSEAFSYQLDNTLPLSDMAAEQKGIVNTVANQSGFSTVFIFGDYERGLKFFIDSVTGNFLWNSLDVIGINFHPLFKTGLSAVWGVVVVYTFIYIVSGRGTKSSI